MGMYPHTHTHTHTPLVGKHTDSAVYDLVGVVNHSGTMNGGHYTAYNFNTFVRRWYHYDDSRVTMLEPQEPVTDTLAAKVAAEKEAAAESAGKTTGEESGAANTEETEPSSSPSPAVPESDDKAPADKGKDVEEPEAMDVEESEAMDVEDPAEEKDRKKEKEHEGKPLSSYKPEELRAALHSKIISPKAYLLFYLQRETAKPYDGEPFEIPADVRKEFEVDEKKTTTSEPSEATAEAVESPAPVDSKTPDAVPASGPTASSGPMDIDFHSPTSTFDETKHTRSKSDPARIHPASIGAPTDDAINQFIAIVACDRDVAVLFLSQSGNNVNRAVDMYFGAS